MRHDIGTRRRPALSVLAFLASVIISLCLDNVTADEKDSLTHTTYDQAKNRTNVGFSEAPVYSGGDDTVLLTVSCGYDGREPKAPEQCLVIFRVMTPDKSYCQDGTYLLIRDGHKTKLGFKNYGCDPAGSHVNADLFALWTFQHLSDVANAKHVSFKIRRIEVSLDDRVMTGIRDIYAHFRIVDGV